MDPEGEQAWRRMEERKKEVKLFKELDKKDSITVLQSIGKAPGVNLRDGRTLTAKRVVTREYNEEDV